MSMSLSDWLEHDVRPMRDKPLAWLSEHHFFRDPSRPTFSDTASFFAPADGIILYQIEVGPDEPIVDIKGKPYSLRDALQDASYDKPCLVLGIFMTFFDVHVNRVPFSGRLTYRQVDAIDTYNLPMLEMETGILEDMRVSMSSAEYLRRNQRTVNRVYVPDLEMEYFILQIADYDVDCILPFNLKQNQPVAQGQRFSQIRYGSQVDLIVPLSPRFEFSFVQETGHHVEAGVDRVLAVSRRQP